MDKYLSNEAKIDIYYTEKHCQINDFCKIPGWIQTSISFFKYS